MTQAEMRSIENLKVVVDKSKPRPFFDSGEYFADWWWKVLNPHLEVGGKIVLVNRIETDMQPDWGGFFKTKQSALDAGDFLSDTLRAMGRIIKGVELGRVHFISQDNSPVVFPIQPVVNKKPADEGEHKKIRQ